MLWEAGWEWARLTKSKYISIEITCPSSFFLLPSSFLLLPSSFYPYSLLVYSSLRAELTRLRVGFLPYVIFALKTRRFVRSYPKKVEKRQAKTPLLKIRSTPIALAALPADFSIFSVPPLCQFSCDKKNNDFLKSCSNI